MHSIRAKLLIAILSTLAIIFTLSTVLNVHQVSTAMQEQIDATGSTRVEERAFQFTYWIGTKFQELRHLSSHAAIQNPDPELDDPRGEYLRQQRSQTYTSYEVLYFADVNGQAQITRNEVIDVRDRDFFVEALNGNQFLSSPFQSEVTRANVVAFSSPVYDQNRVIMGVVVGYVHLETLGLLTFGSLADPATRSQAMVVDGNGTVVVHPNSALIGSANINNPEDMPGIASVANEILQNNTGQTSYEHRDSQEFVYYDRLANTNNWSLVYIISGETLAGPVDTIRNWLLISNLIAVALVAGVIILVAEAITRPLRRMVTVMGEIATGDLTQKVKSQSRDEVGQTARYANTMAESLANIVRELKQISNTVVSSGQQIAASIMESTTGLEQSSILATEIGSNMQLNAASVDQTKNSAQHVASSAQAVSELTSEAARECATAVHQATTGGQAVADVVNAMGEISLSSEQVNQLVENLIDSAQRIEDMLELITQISEQTNLLSLNAAIEAARAGEMGQGFAVVASEVRKLATRSTHAVEEIGQLVEDIRRKVDITSQAVGQSNTIIHQAEERSQVTLQTIESMVASINSVEQKISRVTEAASEQAVNSNAIREAVTNIAASTQETSAGAEELGATLEEQVAILADIETTVADLTGMVQKLDQMMQKFVVGDEDQEQE
ncbi:MAG: methyl-accepting chemotaxis protein [Firmicutes bacterium]|nr:methyl-accepting chemotaxis protein [Bacillota bacterium]